MIISLSVPYVLLMWFQRLESNIPLSPSSLPEGQVHRRWGLAASWLVGPTGSLETTSSWTLFRDLTFLTCLGGFVVVQWSETQFWERPDVYKKLLLLMVTTLLLTCWSNQQVKIIFLFYQYTPWLSPLHLPPAVTNMSDIEHTWGALRPIGPWLSPGSVFFSTAKEVVHFILTGWAFLQFWGSENTQIQDKTWPFHIKQHKGETRQ